MTDLKLTSKEIAAAKTMILGEEANTKVVTCPAHSDGHRAILYIFPHKYAGTYECPVTGMSDSCPHENYHTEEVENLPTSPEDNPLSGKVYVCDDCEIQLENYEPEEDFE